MTKFTLAMRRFIAEAHSRLIYSAEDAELVTSILDRGGSKDYALEAEFVETFAPRRTPRHKHETGDGMLHQSSCLASNYDVCTCAPQRWWFSDDYLDNLCSYSYHTARCRSLSSGACNCSLAGERKNLERK